MNARQGSLPPLRCLNTAEMLRRPLQSVAYDVFPVKVATQQPALKKQLLYQKVEEIMRQAIGPLKQSLRPEAPNKPVAPLVAREKRSPRRLRVAVRSTCKPRRSSAPSCTTVSGVICTEPSLPDGLPRRTTIFSKLKPRPVQELEPSL